MRSTPTSSQGHSSDDDPPPVPSSAMRWTRGLLAACCGALLAACGGSSGDSATTPPPPAGVAPPTPVAGAKPLLRGLVTMGKFSAVSATPPVNDLAEARAHPAIYSAVVIGLFWSQLEPTAGVFDDSALTAALGTVAAYNAAHPTTPVVAKLRIFAGAGTPAWVIQSIGSVTLSDDMGNTLTVGRFWTTAYQTAWRGLQAHLAATYDGSSTIGEIAITSCATLTGEPFILPHNAASNAALRAAGYTDAAAKNCLSQAPADYAGWLLTPLDYTFNVFVDTDSGAGVADPAFTVSVMAAFRTALGVRAVVANHGLDTAVATGAQPIFSEFQTLYTGAQGMTPPVSPLEFQTLSPTVDWPNAIALGLTYHPTEIEIWDTVAAGGLAPLSTAQLQQWATALK